MQSWRHDQAHQENHSALIGNVPSATATVIWSFGVDIFTSLSTLMFVNRRYVPAARESALVSTGSCDTDELDNATDAVSTALFFNAPFGLVLFSLGGEIF